MNYIVSTGWSPSTGWLPGLLDNDLVINLDNYPGQNKNNFVLWLANILVKKCLLKSIAFNFLVKGYTKNACNHSFNLMKKEYHLQNTHTKEQAIKQLGKHDNVTIINTTLSLFYDFRAF